MSAEQERLDYRALRNPFSVSNAELASRFYGDGGWERVKEEQRVLHHEIRAEWLAREQRLGPVEFVELSWPDYDGRRGEWRSRILP